MNGPVFTVETEQKLRQGKNVASGDEELWVLVPVKSLAHAKQRLADCMGADREGLTIAMLKDVLKALADSSKVLRVVIVTADPKVKMIAEQGSALVIEEKSSTGMNVAIHLGIGVIRKLGAIRVVILPADIPLMTGAEFDRIAGLFEHEAQNETGGYIGISPSSDEGGTNCLFLDPRRAFTFRYGPDSFNLHRASAAKCGQRPISLYSSTISMDIDERQDVDALQSFCLQNPEFQETATWKFLRQTGRTG